MEDLGSFVKLGGESYYDILKGSLTIDQAVEYLNSHKKDGDRYTAFWFLHKLKRGYFRGFWLSEICTWRIPSYQFDFDGMVPYLGLVQTHIPLLVETMRIVDWMTTVHDKLRSAFNDRRISPITYLQEYRRSGFKEENIEFLIDLVKKEFNNKV